MAQTGQLTTIKVVNICKGVISHIQNEYINRNVIQKKITVDTAYENWKFLPGNQHPSVAEAVGFASGADHAILVPNNKTLTLT
jgi:hypothetical protein